MRLIVDMNLSPQWVDLLVAHGHEAVHWMHLGAATAPDTAIMQAAREQGAIVFTHDLDFGALLAASREQAPSVLQLRMTDVLPEACGATVLAALRQFEAELTEGAFLTLDPRGLRARLLPLRP